MFRLNLKQQPVNDGLRNKGRLQYSNNLKGYINMKWDDVLTKVSEVQSSKSDSDGSAFLKMKPGTHNIRVIPAGNTVEDVPYLETVQHAHQVLTSDGKAMTAFSLCYNHIAKNLQTLGKYLATNSKIKQDDLALFKQHGCPGCRAINTLEQKGVAKEIWAGSAPKISYFINVIFRPDGKIYVWNISKKIFGDIFGPLKAMFDNKINPLDPNTGFDLSVTATGENFQRRYSATYMPIPRPLGLSDGQVFFDLYEIAGRTCKSYNQFADLVAMAFGKYFDNLGVTVPGSSIQNVFNQAVNPPTVAKTEASIFATEPSKDEFEVLGDGLTFKGGTLYGKDGKPLF